MTAKDDIDDRIEGFRSGVDMYLTKPFEPNELIVIIRNILERVERTHSTIARLVGHEEPEETVFVRDEELTEAEWRVAESVARGLSNKEIAAELNLSIRTVENHVSRILAFSKNNFIPAKIAQSLLKTGDWVILSFRRFNRFCSNSSKFSDRARSDKV